MTLNPCCSINQGQPGEALPLAGLENGVADNALTKYMEVEQEKVPLRYTDESLCGYFIIADS
jgi:hypothetical protein